jgi:enoyl-CoA hydratase
MPACDMVIAGASARLGVPEVKRALFPPGGGAIRLPRRIPYVLAMELLLTGEAVTATRGAELGLVNRVVADGEALPAALDLARRVADNGPLAVRATKQIASRAAAWDEEQAFALQQDMIDPVFSSEDAHEGATAFSEKRAPVWKGR